MASKLTARKEGGWKAVSLAPDVCKTPVGSAIVPVPYPVVAHLGQAKKTAKTVRVNGHEVVLFDATQVPRTKGDQAGLAKGIKSNTTGAASWPKAHSRNVYVQGKPIVRHGDLFWMNGKKGNANTLGRLIGKVSPAAVPASRANPPVMPETDKEHAFTSQLASGAINRQQLVNGIARLLPAIGSIPGGAEAVVKLGQGDYANAVVRLAALSPFAHPGAANAGEENAAQAQANAGHNTQAGNAAATAAGAVAAAMMTAADEQTNLSLNDNGGNSSGSKGGGGATGLEPAKPIPEDRCELKPYGSRPCKGKGKIAHHVVPDRAFRLGTRRGNRAPILGNLPDASGNPSTGVSLNQGLAICLTKDEHNKVHDLYDKLYEPQLRALGSPPGMASLRPVEQAAAEAVAKVTRCNKSYLTNQLRNYHNNKGMGANLKVRVYIRK